VTITLVQRPLVNLGERAKLSPSGVQTIVANVTGLERPLLSVEFYVNGNLQEEDETAPFSFDYQYYNH